MDAESIAKTVETCCRCGSPLEHDPVLILVQSGPLHSAHPVINLCPSCAGSMTRWFARGQSSRPAGSRRRNPPSGRPAHPATDGIGDDRGAGAGPCYVGPSRLPLLSSYSPSLLLFSISPTESSAPLLSM